MTQIDRQNLNRLVRKVADALDEAKSIVSMDIDKFSVDKSQIQLEILCSGGFRSSGGPICRHSGEGFQRGC